MQLKKRVLAQLNKADERLLRIIAAVMDSYESDDEIVAYTAKGEAITKKMYIQNNEDAVLQFQEGRAKPHEELKSKYQT